MYGILEDRSLFAPTGGIVLPLLSVRTYVLRVFFSPRNYYDQTDALIYVIDSADTRRVEETGVELQQLLDEERLSSIPLLIMANKQDLISALSPAELTEKLGLEVLHLFYLIAIIYQR